MILIRYNPNKKASIRWQDSAPPISGYWPTSEPNAGDHDFPLTGSIFGNLTPFRAIFSHIFTAHAQEWPFMNFRLKFWHHHSNPWSRFPYRARYFRNTRTFSVDFCIRYAECPPYFYFRSSWPIDLESVTWCAPRGDSFHQVWSWYDHPLPRYSVIAADTLCNLETLTF